MTPKTPKKGSKIDKIGGGPPKKVEKIRKVSKTRKWEGCGASFFRPLAVVRLFFKKIGKNAWLPPFLIFIKNVVFDPKTDKMTKNELLKGQNGKNPASFDWDPPKIVKKVSFLVIFIDF